MIEVQLLGPFALLRDGQPIDLGTPKQVLLAASLAIRAPAVVSKDRLIDDLWGERAPVSASSTFAGYLSNLRKAIESGRSAGDDKELVATRRPGYLLDVPEASIDLKRFRTLVQRAAQAGNDHEAHQAPREAIRFLDEALDLVHGPALDDLRFEQAFERMATQIDDEVLAARERRFEYSLTLGQADPAELAPLLADHPLREHLRALHIRALYQQGRQADAIRALDNARTLLVEELGIDPGPELQRLESDILNQSPLLERTERPSNSTVANETEPLSAATGVPAVAVLPLGHEERPADSIHGRDAELEVIRDALDDLQAGRGASLLMSGPPGIGKSHLVLHLIEEAQRRGIALGHGAYSESGARPPLSGWNDARRTLAASLGDRLFELFPAEMIEQVLSFTGGEIQGSISSDSIGRTENLYELLDLMAAATTMMAEQQPLVVVLEDLHWADDLTFVALRHWSRLVESCAVVIVVSFRPDELGDGAEGQRWLSMISGQPRTLRLSLEGLSPAGVAAMAHDGGIPLLSPPALEELVRRTSGSPLFVKELCRLAQSSETDLLSAELPRELLGVVSERIARLHPEVLEVLTSASLAEGTIDPEVDASLLELEPDDVDELMSKAVAGGILVHDAELAGNYRFTTALAREALSASIGPRRRARLHARRGEVTLEQLGQLEPDAEVTIAVARHFCLGARAGTAAEGVDFALRAAKQSMEAFGHSIAWNVLGLGLSALRYHPDPTPNLRLELLRWRAAAAQAIGLDTEALQDYLDAFRTAMDASALTIAAEVALAAREGTGLPRARTWWNPAATAAGMLKEAYDALTASPSVAEAHPELVAELLGSMAADGAGFYDEAHRSKLADAAVDLARSVDGPALADAMIRRVLTGWLDRTPTELLADLDELVATATRTGHEDAEMMARTYACSAELERGDVEATEQRLAEAVVRVKRLGIPPWRNYMPGVRVLINAATGRPDAAERDSVRVLDKYSAMGPLVTDHLRFTIVFARILQNNSAAVLDESIWPEAIRDRRPAVASIAAFVHAEAGEFEQARKELDRFRHRDHLRAETQAYGGYGWALALGTRALLGEVSETRDLYERAAHLTGRQIIPGPGWFYALPADYYLGLAAKTLGDSTALAEHVAITRHWAEAVGSTQVLDRLARFGEP